jgi:DNA-nicking Smr family endonuclease
MPKKPDISDQDREAFRNAVKGIKPLSHTKIDPAPDLPKPRKKAAKLTDEPAPDMFSDYENLPTVSSHDLLEYYRPGIQHKILRNLRNGKYNIESILDLHGQTVVEARQSLSQFLLTCQRKGVRHILIIHGKGHSDKPILKNKLNHWLRQTEQVLAFSSATARQGRGGALYVLLKKENSA